MSIQTNKTRRNTFNLVRKNNLNPIPVIAEENQYLNYVSLIRINGARFRVDSD